MLTNARVKEVRNDRVLFTQVEDGKTVVKEIPTAFCLWSTGVGKCTITTHQVPPRDLQ